MRETERQINIYKEKLPRMKERVGAALVMLLLAVVMTVSSSMAWLVLSSDPEVKGMNTTITANGNLEIALASGNITAAPIRPAETKIGDSGKPLVERNITWGNLVNLGDDSYGLQKLVLRPATLNRNALKNSPLYAASYGSDGRVDTLKSDFAYSYWNSQAFSAVQADVPYGVRAISSVTYEVTGGEEKIYAARNETQNMFLAAHRHMRTELVENNGEDLQRLFDLVGQFVSAKVQDKLGKKEPEVVISQPQLESIITIMVELREISMEAANALAAEYNLQLLCNVEESAYIEHRIPIVDIDNGETPALFMMTEAEIKAKYAIKKDDGTTNAIVPKTAYSKLAQLKTDYATITSDIATLSAWAESGEKVVFQNQDHEGNDDHELANHVANIVDIMTAEINGTRIVNLSMDAAMGMLGNDNNKVVVTNGILQRLDHFLGAEFEVKNVSVKVTGIPILGTVTAGGTVTTSAKSTETDPFVLPTENAYACSLGISYAGKDLVASDTFGMALDFFLRTNAPNAHLILQGSPVYETEIVTVKATDEKGMEYDVYTFTVDEIAVTAILKDGVYYSYNVESKTIGDAIANEADVTNATLYTEEISRIVGYNGVNRVWDTEGDVLLDETSTTQGAGSCYTFYAATPEDQEKSLQLLSHFKIAFVNENGNFLGSASLDVENKFEQTGKVTVPLVLDITNESVTVNGETVYTITELQRNEATFITALVYLDGEGLSNDQVLAAGEIQGQLNIQFGTTTDLEAMNDPVLKEEKCSVTATMPEPYTVAFDTATVANMTKAITVTVDGYTPSKVEAYFLREINATQGIRQGKIENFTKNDDGKWVGSYQFTSPGKYILREVILDGVTYELNQEPLAFTVTGFTITSVSCANNHKSYILTDKSFDTSVSLTFAASDPNKMPSSVKGAFIHSETGNRTTVYFTRGTGGTWTGSATLTTSGVYKMEYVELNNEYYGLEQNQFISIDLTLGVTASVYSKGTNFAIENGKSQIVQMSMEIRADSGEYLEELSGVNLYYSNNGSGIQEIGLSANMVWNPSTGLYEGEYNLTKAGIYDFGHAKISETSTIYTAAVAPTITVISTTVPEYVSKNIPNEVFSLNNDATFSITFKDASSATVDAKLTNGDNVYYVRGVMSTSLGNQVFTFTVPVIDGKQSGTWTLEEVYMTNVYGGANNTLWNGSTDNGPDTATEEKPMYTVSDNYYSRWLKWSLDMLGVTDGAAPSVTVVSNVNVSFTNSDLNANKEFGKTNGTVDGLFGKAYTLGNLEISVTTGSEGKPLSDYGLKVSSVKLSYAYDVSELGRPNNLIYRNTYGSYTVEQGDFNGLIGGSAGKKEYSLASSDGSKYTLAPAASNNTLNVAGSYKATSMVVTIVSEDGTGEELVVNVPVANAPVYKVWSKAPTATITGVSGSPSKQEKITWTQANNCSSNAPDFAVATDNNSATAGVDSANNKAVLYGDASADNSTQHNGSFAQPTLTVTIAGISDDSTASFVLPANGNAPAVTFSRTGNGTISNKIGATAQIKSWTTSLILTHRLNAYYGHGTQTIDQLTVTQNGIPFTFTLDKPMTIVNPSSVNQNS